MEKLHHADAIVQQETATSDQSPASHMLETTNSGSTNIPSLRAPFTAWKPSKAVEFSRLERKKLSHRPCRSESAISLGALPLASRINTDSETILSRERADYLWNQQQFEQLAQLEDDRERVNSQVLELEKKLASSNMKLVQANWERDKTLSETKKILEKTLFECYDATENETSNQFRGGWDMEYQLLHCELFSKTTRVAKLEKKLTKVSKDLIERENAVEKLQTRVQDLKKATGDLRLLVYRDASASESYQNTRTPMFLREWAIKTCIMRCIIALTAKEFGKAEMHASCALEMSGLMKNDELTAECHFWHGVSLCCFDRFAEAIDPLQNAISNSELRRREAMKWYLIANKHCNNQLRQASRSPDEIEDDIKTDRYLSPDFSNWTFEIPGTAQQRPVQLDPSLPNYDYDDERIMSRRAISRVSSSGACSSEDEQLDLDATTPRTFQDVNQSSESDDINYSPRTVVSNSAAETIGTNTESDDILDTSKFAWTTVPSLIVDDGTDISSREYGSPEPPIDGQIFASIDELIQPHIVGPSSQQDTSPPSTLEEFDSVLSNELLYAPHSFTARRQAAGNTIKRWRLQVPVQHREVLGDLSELPSGKRTALPRPGHESPPTPPTSFSPDTSPPLLTRRNRSWGDMRSMVRGLGKNVEFAKGQAAQMVKLARHSAMKTRREKSSKELSLDK